MSNKPISKSKAKRLKMQNELKLQRQKKAIKILWAILIPVVILAMVVFATLYLNSQKIDYEKYLNDDGTISDININDYVTNNYQKMSFSKKGLSPTRAEIDEALEKLTESYATEVDGVTVVPEFNDDFVISHLSDEASSAQEYEQKLIKSYYETNLKNAIQSSLSENCIVNKCPDNYVTKIEKIYDKQYENYAESKGVTKESLAGVTTSEEYDAFIHNSAVTYTENALMYQAVYEAAGLTNDTANAKKILYGLGYSEEDYKEAVDLYGEKYVNAMVIDDIVIDYLMKNVLITE